MNAACSLALRLMKDSYHEKIKLVPPRTTVKHLKLCVCVSVSAACGGFIELAANDPPGYITSPDYPQNYPQNIDCVWVLTVPNGESVRLDFEDEFYIESSSRYGSIAPVNPDPPLC